MQATKMQAISGQDADKMRTSKKDSLEVEGDLDKETLAKGVFATIATYATLVMGEADRALGVLITLIVLDYVSGVAAAYHQKELSSEIGLRGMIKKGLMLILVMVGHQVDVMLGTQGATRTAVIWILAANEGVSITENAAKCDVEIPLLSQALKMMKQKAESKMPGGDSGG